MDKWTEEQYRQQSGTVGNKGVHPAHDNVAYENDQNKKKRRKKESNNKTESKEKVRREILFEK